MYKSKKKDVKKFASFFSDLNKQYKTVDNSYMLLYSVCIAEVEYESNH